MRILVINSGSSSIKFSYFNADNLTPQSDPSILLSGELAGLNRPDATLSLSLDSVATTGQVDATSPLQAIQAVTQAIESAGLPAADAIGYRVVHPGPHLRGHQRITPAVLDDLDQAAAFAPLHDPIALAMMRAMLDFDPDTPRFACFDTVFHQTLPEEASIYPVPAEFRAQGVHRYGFHGLSCESIVRRVRLNTGAFPRRVVIAHLGSGCSVTALLEGQSVDTSMGLTPTGGVVMGTRPGDLDPGLILYLLRQKHEADPTTAVETILNRASGLVALSGMPNDVRALRQAAASGNPDAILALKVFTRSIRKTIGSYAFLLGGLDAIFFTGGIGEHDPLTRSEVLADLDEFGISPNATQSRIAVQTIPAEEDLMIALHVYQMLQPTPKEDHA
jgi:acetate kinase